MLKILEDFTNERREEEIEVKQDAYQEFINYQLLAANIKQVNSIYMLECTYNNENEANKDHKYKTYTNNVRNLETDGEDNILDEEESLEQDSNS
ncbi:3994_t:CDS:2 [Racocetra fulgida]|uniref:3994_t:CDS:1 n=1 Tax=Racocetra fulgida TaxID=60492 RepID=A0A9N8Z865_9GLOM|nr:3994_t:CDS:2 [Racocetra fulgida]